MSILWRIGRPDPFCVSVAVRATAATAVFLVALVLFWLRRLLVFCNRLLTWLMLIRRSLLGCLLLGMLLLLLLLLLAM